MASMSGRGCGNAAPVDYNRARPASPGGDLASVDYNRDVAPVDYNRDVAPVG